MERKTMLAHVNGWTPVIDNLVKEFGAITALVFGVVWRHCQMRNGVCTASQEHMAELVGLSRQSINSHLSKLVDGGYLRDLTPDYRNRPHVYKDTGKASITINIDAKIDKGGVNDIDSTVKEIDSSVKEIDTNTLINKQLSNAKFDDKPITTSTSFQLEKNIPTGKAKRLTFAEKLAVYIREQNRTPDMNAIDKAIAKWNKRCEVVNKELPPENQWSNTNVDAILEQYDIIVLTSS